MNEHKGIASNSIIHKAASRKGGLRKVPKGFAMNRKLASEAGKKGVVITNEIRSGKIPRRSKEDRSDGGQRLADILGDISE